MEVATHVFDARGFAIINCCRIYLQIISIGDLLLLGKASIHPSYIVGKRPTSQQSLILWPSTTKPPTQTLLEIMEHLSDLSHSSTHTTQSNNILSSHPDALFTHFLQTHHNPPPI